VFLNCVKRTLPLCFLAAASLIQGNTLPAATSLATCTDGSGATDTEVASCSIGGGSAFAFGSLVESPFANLSAQGAWTPGSFSAGAFFNLTYSFEVTGGTVGDQVPLLISTALISTGVGGFGFSEIVVNTSLSSLSESVCSDGTCPAEQFIGTLDAMAFSGTVDTVTLEVEVIEGFGSSANTSSASADPLIFVDPTFAGASNYAIVQSDGVGNGFSSAPEPGTIFPVALAGGAFLIFRKRISRIL
jgi:hypothetical protein